MEKSFIQISREIENWGWYQDSNTFRVFFHLLLKAQTQSGNEIIGIQLERGQVVVGRKKLSVDLGISEQSIRTSIERLSKSREITIKTTNKYSIITICKYDVWTCGCFSGNQQNNQQITNKQPAELHKIDNEKRTLSDIENAFEQFRLKYKKYGGKVRGFQTELDDFKKKHKDWKEVIPLLDAAIEKENRERMQANASRTFFPQMKNLKTYLNQRSWESFVDNNIGTSSTVDEEYNPICDGVFQSWDDKRKCLLFNGYIHMLNDGYTDETRPDGARIAHNMYEWVWSKQGKEWVKQ